MYYKGREKISGRILPPTKIKHPDFSGERRRKGLPTCMCADSKTLSGCDCGCYEETPEETKTLNLEFPEIDKRWLIGGAIVLGLFFFKK